MRFPLHRLAIVAAFGAVLALAGPAAADAPTTDERIAQLRRDAQELQGALDHVTSQRDVALAQKERAEAVADRESRRAAEWRLTAWAAVALLVLGGGVALTRRRGTVRIRIPDSPETLFDDHPADR